MAVSWQFHGGSWRFAVLVFHENLLSVDLRLFAHEWNAANLVMLLSRIANLKAIAHL